MIFGLFKKNSNSKLKILSAYNFKYRKIGKKSEKNIIKYANHFNFSYEFQKSDKFERPFNWLKIKMLIDNLENNNNEYFLWLDADTFFCRYENILNHIDKSKHLHVHNSFFKSVHKTKYKYVNYLTWAPNSGVLLVRNTKWSLKFFKNVWNNKKFINHFWTDNAAFMDEIGLKTEIGKIADNNISKNVRDKISFLSGIWNSMPKKNFKNPENNELSNFYFDPVIIHLAGIRRRERLKFIREYKNLFI
tara:strand:+ start:158 stop:898 length:741 start_codon:yes stop_codon:yes gene_type:complete